MSEIKEQRSAAKYVPTIRVPVRPVEVPSELLALDPDSSIYLEWRIGRVGSRIIPMSASEGIEEIQKIMRRQAAGKFELYEAVQLIAEAQNADVDDLKRRLEWAFESGELPFRKDDSEIPKNPMREVARTSDILSVSDLDAWLAGKGISYRFPEVATSSTMVTVTSSIETNASPNTDLLATRQQLIDAFGRFVGMDLAWFKSLNDAPALRDARKIVGRSGKPGHSTEPMFCPFEVMMYATKPGRRVKRPLSEDTAWSLLDRYFPKVYAAKQIGDPRSNS